MPSLLFLHGISRHLRRRLLLRAPYGDDGNCRRNCRWGPRLVRLARGRGRCGHRGLQLQHHRRRLLLNPGRISSIGILVVGLCSPARGRRKKFFRTDCSTKNTKNSRSIAYFRKEQRHNYFFLCELDTSCSSPLFPLSPPLRPRCCCSSEQQSWALRQRRRRRRLSQEGRRGGGGWRCGGRGRWRDASSVCCNIYITYTFLSCCDRKAGLPFTAFPHPPG